LSLNITIVTGRYILQVSDLSLTAIKKIGPPSLFTNYAIKSTVISCRDALVSCVYHGIGEFDHLRTDAWLVEEMSKCNISTLPLQNVVKLIRTKFTEWYEQIAKYTRCNMPHTFVLAGYHSNGKAFYALISNYERFTKSPMPTELSNHFRSSGIVLRKYIDTSCFVSIRGYNQDVSESDTKLLWHLSATSGAKPKDVTAVAVRTLRKVASLSDCISNHCISTLMLPNRPSLCHYWSDSDNTKFLPNIIGRCIIHRPVISDGIVVPPWQIRNAIPTGVQDLDLLKELRNFPNNYKSGEPLSREISDQLNKFI